MILYFCNITNISLEEDFPKIKEKDIVESFLTLYEDGSKLIRNFKKETIKKLLVEILYLSSLLDFTLEDITRETKKKSLVIQERLKSDY